MHADPYLGAEVNVDKGIEHGAALLAVDRIVADGRQVRALLQRSVQARDGDNLQRVSVRAVAAGPSPSAYHACRLDAVRRHYVPRQADAVRVLACVDEVLVRHGALCANRAGERLEKFDAAEPAAERAAWHRRAWQLTVAFPHRIAPDAPCGGLPAGSSATYIGNVARAKMHPARRVTWRYGADRFAHSIWPTGVGYGAALRARARPPAAEMCWQDLAAAPNPPECRRPRRSSWPRVRQAAMCVYVINMAACAEDDAKSASQAPPAQAPLQPLPLPLAPPRAIPTTLFYGSPPRNMLQRSISDSSQFSPDRQRHAQLWGMLGLSRACPWHPTAHLRRPAAFSHVSALSLVRCAGHCGRNAHTLHSGRPKLVLGLTRSPGGPEGSHSPLAKKRLASMALDIPDDVPDAGAQDTGGTTSEAAAAPSAGAVESEEPPVPRTRRTRGSEPVAAPVSSSSEYSSDDEDTEEEQDSFHWLGPARHARVHDNRQYQGIVYGAHTYNVGDCVVLRRHERSDETRIAVVKSLFSPHPHRVPMATVRLLLTRDQCLAQRAATAARKHVDFVRDAACHCTV